MVSAVVREVNMHSSINATGMMQIELVFPFAEEFREELRRPHLNKTVVMRSDNFALVIYNLLHPEKSK
jgi:hypothetical protein